MIDELGLTEELRGIALRYPVAPRDTLSHATLDVCATRGWIVRNADGHWIPTAKGLGMYETLNARHPKKEKGNGNPS